MTPVANFQITPNLLSVKFTDISTGTPTSWSWDFGDSGSSTSQNPSHAFSASGTYIVKLTATNTSGSSTFQRTIIVSTIPTLPVTLKTFVSLKLPSALNISEEIKDAYIAQWQLYIQPLVLPVIDYNQVFAETAYPPLANALIAMLSAYSILSDIAFNSAAQGASSGMAGVAGIVKKITTGPSDVEFQDIANLQKSLAGKEGLLKQMENELCTLAYRLRINLPMCPKLATPIFIPLKAGRPNHHTFRFNPLAIQGSEIRTRFDNSPWLGYPFFISLTC